MKKLISILAGLLAFMPIAGWAQPTPIGGAPAASQAEVDAGTVTNKYVSPLTLTNWTGGGSGTPGGNPGDLQYNNAGAFGGITPGAGVSAALAVAINAGSGVVALNANSTLTLPGSVISAPETITIAEGAPDTGTIDITKKYSQATIDEATTLTPSAAGTAGQFCALDITNSGTAIFDVTVDTATDFTITAMPGRTTTALLRSIGTGWVLVGGNPAVVEKIASFSVDGAGSPITSGTCSGTSTLDAAYMLYAYTITATANSGTITVTFWRAATGTSIPAIGGVINTSGVTLVTNTAVKSTTLTDFAVPSAAAAQTFAAYDMLRCAYTVTGNATDLTVTLYGIRL